MTLMAILGTPCEAHHCISCGVVYVVPQAVIEQHRQKGGYHHCSNGHAQGWDKDGSENEKLRRERDRLKQQAARLEEEKADARRAAEIAEQETETERKKVARLRKRATAGVCPCCNRTVRQMALHMKTKHPSYNVVPLKSTA